jgi:hypothetical protein
VHLGAGGHDDDRGGRVELERSVEDVVAVAVGQMQIEQDDVERSGRERLRGAGRGRRS